MQNYLHEDIYTSPRFRANQTIAESMQQVRLDSSGYPLRRTICGEETVFDATKHRKTSNNLQTKKTGKRSPNSSIKTPNSQYRSSTKNQQPFPRNSSLHSNNSALKSSVNTPNQRNQHNRNLTVGFASHTDDPIHIPSLTDQSKDSFNPLTARLQKALKRHLATQADWQGHIKSMRSLRNISPKEMKFAKDPSRTRMTQRSALKTCLIEQQHEFSYNEHGTKNRSPTGLPHTCDTFEKPREPADLQARSHKFYQDVRGCGVSYTALNAKNSQQFLFSTIPVKKSERPEPFKRVSPKKKK